MISYKELDNLFNTINSKLSSMKIKAYFDISNHSFERINNKRNSPKISFQELDSIFNLLLETKEKQLRNILKNSDKYTVFACISNIDIWIAINSNGKMVIKSLIRHNKNNKYPPILRIDA